MVHLIVLKCRISIEKCHRITCRKMETVTSELEMLVVIVSSQKVNTDMVRIANAYTFHAKSPSPAVHLRAKRNLLKIHFLFVLASFCKISKT